MSADSVAGKHAGKGGGGGGGGGRLGRNATRTGGAKHVAGATLRAALCLHGKIGSIDRGQGWTRAVDNAAPTIDVGVISYAGFVRHVFEANRATHTIDVFGHSWSPDVGPTLDALYQPAASHHEREEIMRNRQLCQQIGSKLVQLTAALGTTDFMKFGVVGRGANSCERTASHLLGMQRAIQLKARAERAGGYVYDVVMVARWDVLWSRPFLFSRVVNPSRDAFFLPTYCTHASHVDHKADVERKLMAYRNAVCGGAHSHGQVPTAASSCHPSHRPCSPDLSARARELYLLDWWFVSSSKSADGFALVADPPLFTNYTLLNQLKLVKPSNGRPVIMGHAYWGMHMVWGLRAPLKFVSAIAVDFSLGRVWKRDEGANTCRALKTACKEPACSEADVIARPWHAQSNAGVDAKIMLRAGPAGAYLPMPTRPALEYRFGAEQTRFGCGEGYFTCSGLSTMCKEEQRTWEPMDTTLMRKAWINCTARLCPRVSLHPYAPRCAGAMLYTWAALWKRSPLASNTSLALEFGESIMGEGSAMGWYDPSDASAALATLGKRAHDVLSHDHREAAAAAASTRTSLAGLPPAKLRSVLDQCVETEVEKVKLELLAEKAKAAIKSRGRRLSTDARLWAGHYAFDE